MSIIAIIISLGTAVAVALAWWTARKTLIHHALAGALKDYRSPEMLFAIERLWQLYQEHDKEKLAEEYERIRKQEEDLISSLEEGKNRIEAKRTTLHYQRRLVSIFYQHLAALRANRILPDDILFKNWSEKDLKIIPNVIIPIEIKLEEVFPSSAEEPVDEKKLPSDLSGLYRLYKDSKNHSPSEGET